MKEKELIELLSSIIEANRTFYVGAASPVDNDGQVSLNGISARAIGASETNDVIVKDSQTGIWYAFVRGYGQQIVSSRNISLFQQHPRDKKTGGFFIFVATESLQDKLLFTQIKQLSGAYELDNSPVYSADIAPWIISAPGTYTFNDDYLAFPSPSAIHSVIGNAVFEPAGERLNLKESFFSSSAMAKVSIGKIKKDSETDQTFLEFIFTPSVATSGIRRAVERWSLGLSKDGLAAAGGAFNSIRLRKSLTISFKNERNKKYGDFYAWYKHIYNLTGQLQDPAKIPQDPVTSCSTAQLEMVTEQPNVSSSFSDVVNILPIGTDVFGLPPETVSLPADSITVEFHYGDGAFDFGTNVTTLVFSKEALGGRLRKTIRYSIKKSATPIARKAKLYINVSGVRRYAKYVRYQDTDQYRIGFFDSASQASDTDLFFYISPSDTIPRNIDKDSASAFLLNESVVFSASGEERFEGDDFLWRNVSGTGSFGQNGFIDPSFSEKGDIDGYTFFKESADVGDGLYQEPQSIQFDILTESVYSEEIEFYDDANELLGSAQNPSPRLTKESKIRVRMKGTNRTGGYLCGNRGRCLESYQYQVHQTLLSVAHDFEISLTFPTPETNRFYFPDKSTIPITREFPQNVYRTAKPYVIVGGARRYGGFLDIGTADIVLSFDSDKPTREDGTVVFAVELDSLTARVLGRVSPSNSRTLVEAPFSETFYLTFPVGAEKRGVFDDFLWIVDSRAETPGFSINGFINPSFGAAPFRQGSYGASWIPVTIQLDILPEEFWGKTERIIFDGTEISNSPYVSRHSDRETSSPSRLRVFDTFSFTRNAAFSEEAFEVNPSINNIFYPCTGVDAGKNRDPLADRSVVFGFEHLLPSQSFAINMAATQFSFSVTSVEVFGDGRILFGALELTPFLAALDTTDFTPSDLFTAGYISYQEGYIDEEIFGEDRIRALQIRWGRAYAFDPSANNYYSEDPVEFEAIFVDLADRVDVIFRYKQVGSVENPVQWNTSSYDTGHNLGGIGVPIAGIQEDQCIFEGSGSLDNQAALATGSVSSEVPGDYVFYIQNGEIHGYNEVTLFEGGSSPTRKSVVPYKDSLRPQGCLVRIESKKKVSFYLTDKITGGEIDLTSPLPPLLSANTLIGDPSEPSPLLNKNKLIG